MIKKFYGSTTREALLQVRGTLGDDAVILSNRQVAGGVEIMAVADRDMASLTDAPTSAPSLPRPESPKSALAPPRVEAAVAPSVMAAPATKIARRGVEHRAEGDSKEDFSQDIVREIRSMRRLLENQLASIAWSEQQRREPEKVDMLRRMLMVGLSPALARQLLDRVPAGYNSEKALKWVKSALVHNLHAVTSGNDIIEKGGVYALVGPTGIGKTTTVAKLAARYTLKHGPTKLALLTTDGYRIGAHDQLRIYGRILGVPVYSIKDQAELKLTLSDLRSRHLILVDTVGMGQRDHKLAQQLSMLRAEGLAVKRLLLLNATAQGSTLEDVVRAYRGDGLEGCILTKVDEALSIGNALDVILRRKLTLHYVANGQRVPEDIHLANPFYLVDRAFKAGELPSAFTLQEADFPLTMASEWDGSSAEGELQAKLRQVRDDGAYRG